MAHLVKCKICGETFNRDKEKCVLVSARRYAHAKCVDSENNNTKVELSDYELLEQYILKLFHIEFLTPRMKKQINQFTEEYKYTLSGIRKTLYYFFEIKGNPIEKAFESLGIVPYVYKEANEYFYKVYLAQCANAQIEDISYETKVINIKSPEVQSTPLKLFNFD